MGDQSEGSPTSTDTKSIGHADETTEKVGHTAIQALPSSVNDAPHNHRFRSNTWQPSLFRIRPIVGLAAWVVAFVCLFASLYILISSNGVEVDQWTFQPTVLLAIVTAISNTAINVALAQAAPISWWYKVFRGSTVSDLELEWEAGQSFLKAMIRGLRQGRYFNLLTIASLVTALVVIDGPLLQRSSTVHLAPLDSVGWTTQQFPPELPTGFSGTVDFWIWRDNATGISANTSAEAVEVGQDFAKQAAMHSPQTVCSGSCSMKVQAPGIARRGCVTKQWPVNETMLKQPSASWGSQIAGVMPLKPLMVVYFPSFTRDTLAASGSGPEEVVVTIGRIELKNYNGSYIETNCTLRAAVVEYDIVIKGQDITFASSLLEGKEIALANNTYLNASSHEVQPMTFAGLQIYMQIYSSANAYFETNIPGDVVTYPAFQSINALTMNHLVSYLNGDVTVSDPTNEVLSNFNELMFRAGLRATAWGGNLTNLMDEGLSANQHVRTNFTSQTSVYHSDLRWFAGAATIQVIALALILPVFWGWWKLGLWDLTLSPFHLAKVFDAPLLRDVNSAAGVREIGRDVGNLQVKLGLIESSIPLKPEIVDEPKCRERRTRLGIAESQSVVPPWKGLKFTE